MADRRSRILIRALHCSVTVTAFALLALGSIASYNFFVAPEDRVGVHKLDGVMFFGPSIASVGLLLFWALRLAKRTPPFAHLKTLARRLKIAGVATAVLPAIAAATLDMLSGGEGMFDFLIALFLFTGPGICLVVFAFAPGALTGDGAER